MNRQDFLNHLGDLSEEIGAEALNSEADPARIMRLTALGVQSCLVGIATLLESERSGYDDNALRDPTSAPPPGSLHDPNQFELLDE